VSKAVPGYLGPYRLQSVVHTGRAFQIWQAFDDAFDRSVGIKTVLEPFRKDREQLRYLETEYAAGRDVVHPNVVSVYGFDLNDGCPYMVMEWFPAPNMRQRIQQGVEKIAPILPKIVVQAAEALAYVNWRGWIHRDIKPDNFLVADDGTVKLVDFALAIRRPRGIRGLLAKRFSRPKKVQGTRGYMSPEQIRCESLDERADLYSFACTVFEMFSGKPPFMGGPDDVLNKHLKSPPPSLDSLVPGVTPELALLIRKSMAKDPNARPESVGEFLREFRIIRHFRAAKSANL
jgi:eukaryotic-like serine/threonine-protein kinase